MKIQWTLISALVFALLTAVFAVINVEPVEVNFGFAKTSTPLILVILTSTLLGGLIVGLFGIIRQYRLQRRIRGLEKRLHELENAAPAADGGVRAGTGSAAAGEPAAAGAQTSAPAGPVSAAAAGRDGESP
ncbi:LapA family protein [Gordoniibacillus kamchatkensis]|uniref:LapA family protein n=1 Tax=Gordoniibacillus kamchatkensis TaxID=1590651 RepID=UPI0009E2FAD9|nr:LapA family protein [Paenibacillus sp. VKM B-2647]